jgi:hypothetical protein
VRKYPSYKKILREVKKVMKISLVHTNGKKECSTKPHVHQKFEIFGQTLHLQWLAQTSKKPEKWPQEL